MAEPSLKSSSEPDFEEIREVLVRCVRQAAPARLRDDIDDIVQKAMVRLMARLEKAEGTSGFATSYLYRVAHNAVIDELRKRGRRREVPSEDHESRTVSSHDPERRVHDIQVGNAIVDCLSRLNENGRLAVSLYLEGHSVPEAAGLLQWPAKRAENFVYRGLKVLRKCLEGKGVTP